MTLFAQSSLFFGWVEVWRQPIDVYLVDSGSKSLFRFTLRLCIRVKNTELLKKQNKNKKNKTICISNRRDSVLIVHFRLGNVEENLMDERDVKFAGEVTLVGDYRPNPAALPTNIVKLLKWNTMGRVHKTPGEQNGRQTVVVVQS